MHSDSTHSTLSGAGRRRGESDRHRETGTSSSARGIRDRWVGSGRYRNPTGNRPIAKNLAGRKEGVAGKVAKFCQLPRGIRPRLNCITMDACDFSKPLIDGTQSRGRV